MYSWLILCRNAKWTYFFFKRTCHWCVIGRWIRNFCPLRSRPVRYWRQRDLRCKATEVALLYYVCIWEWVSAWNINLLCSSSCNWTCICVSFATFFTVKIQELPLWLKNGIFQSGKNHWKSVNVMCRITRVLNYFCTGKWTKFWKSYWKFVHRKIWELGDGICSNAKCFAHHRRNYHFSTADNKYPY